MSHLGGFQIQKAIILAFPIPPWQNSIGVFGNLSILIKKIWKRSVTLPLNNFTKRYDLPLLVLAFTDDPPL